MEIFSLFLGKRAKQFVNYGVNAMIKLTNLFKSLIELQGSDIHLKAGSKPIFRINGRLVDWGDEIVNSEDMTKIALYLMGEDERNKFEKFKEVDFSFGVKGIGRFRVNIYKQRGTVAIAIRSIPVEIKSLAELHLPSVLKKIALKPRGLILVTGTVGSGKSTAIAAMLEHINQKTRSNIITIEDPIEFLFKDQSSVIHQREVGSDTESYATSLKYLLRQDPDVIMIGEIRDSESMYTALRAANTGHLVFTTLHTTDATQTISRVLSFFPSDQQSEIRMLLASTLQAIVSLRLIPVKDNTGRVPASEVLVMNESIRESILDANKTLQIRDFISSGDIYGMQTFDQSIHSLYDKGLISYEEALKYCTSPSDFEREVKGIGSASKDRFELGDYDFSKKNTFYEE